MSVPENYTVIGVDSFDVDSDNVRNTQEYQEHLYQHNDQYIREDERQEFIMECTSLMSAQTGELKEHEILTVAASLETVDQKSVLSNAGSCEFILNANGTLIMDTKSHSLDSDSNQQSKKQTENEWEMISDDDSARYSASLAAGLDYQNSTEKEARSPPINKSVDADNNQMDQNVVVEETITQEDNCNKTTCNDSNNSTSNVENNYHLKLTTDELYELLKEYGVLQDKYHTVLLLPKESKREVTAGGRDGSAYVLRCLKIWYELPSDVLFSAMSLVDRFLDRMTVRPKHMACMSVASFYLAVKQLNLKCVPADDLVTISQCGCTAGDLERMANVIANKLGVLIGHTPVTSVTCLRVYYALFHHLARDIGGDFYKFYQQYIKLEELENRLEVLLCDVRTTTVAPSTLALVLVSLHLDFHIKASYTLGKPELKLVFEYILFLQKFINVPDRAFTCGFSVVSDILTHYNGQNKQPYKQRLVWKLSSRTLRLLRPTNRFSSVLPTIQEGISNTLDEGCRLRTDSSSSEEEEDWPTSHIIPIFEQC